MDSLLPPRECPFRPHRVGLLMLLGLFLSGCASEETFQEEPIKANLRQINKAYHMHLSYHRKPPDEQQLRKAAEDLHRLEMGRPADEAFISPRDNQPLVIIYGAGDSDSPESILAYEQQGLDNSRWVVRMDGEIELLTNEEFSQAQFANKHKPSGT